MDRFDGSTYRESSASPPACPCGRGPALWSALPGPPMCLQCAPPNYGLIANDLNPKAWEQLSLCAARLSRSGVELSALLAMLDQIQAHLR